MDDKEADEAKCPKWKAGMGGGEAAAPGHTAAGMEQRSAFSEYAQEGTHRATKKKQRKEKKQERWETVKPLRSCKPSQSLPTTHS